MSVAIIRRKVEAAGVSYDDCEEQAIAQIARLSHDGWERTSDLAVVQRKHRGNWRFVATFTMSKSKEVGP